MQIDPNKQADLVNNIHHATHAQLKKLPATDKKIVNALLYQCIHSENPSKEQVDVSDSDRETRRGSK